MLCSIGRFISCALSALCRAGTLKIESNVVEETGHVRRAGHVLLLSGVSWWPRHSKDVGRGGC